MRDTRGRRFKPHPKPERIHYSPTGGVARVYADDESCDGLVPYVPADTLTRWAPIETAPVDRYILTYQPGAKWPVVARYRTTGPAGWVYFGGMAMAIDPSHWQPLPEPPA